MSTGVGAAVMHGLGLGAVLAIAAAASLRQGPRGLPHPALGAVAGVAAVAGFRLAGTPRPVVLLVVVVMGALLGGGLAAAERRLPGHPPWLAPIASLGVLLGLAGLLQPLGAATLPFGPLGARGGTTASVVAVVGGVLAAVLLGGMGRWRGLARAEWRWAAGGGAIAAAALLVAGALGPDATRALGIIAVPDTAGLAVRAFAVALLAKDGPTALVVGLGAGVAEALIAARDPIEGLTLAPALVLGAAGLVLRLRSTNLAEVAR